MKPAFNERYGPWALLTGATDGIGKAMAESLAERGLNMILVARRRDRLTTIANDLNTRFGVECQALPTDLADRVAVESLIAQAQQRPIGLLVAAAGFGTSGAFLGTDASDELAEVDVNCRAVLALCKGLVPAMATRGRGGLILLSSIVAFQGVPRASNYAATKAYIQSLAEGLAVELSEHGIDVLASAPGPVASGFARRAGMTLGPTVSSETAARETLDALGQRRTVRPGLLSKLLGYSLATAPRALRVQIMRKIMAGMTDPARSS
jgi:hypothetical protein